MLEIFFHSTYDLKVLWKQWTFYCFWACQGISNNQILEIRLKAEQKFQTKIPKKEDFSRPVKDFSKKKTDLTRSSWAKK